MELRVWNVINPPNKPAYYPVSTPQEAYKKIVELSAVQLMNPNVFSNAFGLEVFEDGEWSEWYNEYGEDVSEAFEN